MTSDITTPCLPQSEIEATDLDENGCGNQSLKW